MEQGNNQLLIWLNFSAVCAKSFVFRAKWMHRTNISIFEEEIPDVFQSQMKLFGLNECCICSTCAIKSNQIFSNWKNSQCVYSRLMTNKSKASFNICPRDNPVFRRLRIYFSFHINSHFTIHDSFHVKLSAIFMDRGQLMRCFIWLVLMEWLLFERRMRCVIAKR